MATPAPTQFAAPSPGPIPGQQALPRLPSSLGAGAARGVAPSEAADPLPPAAAGSDHAAGSALSVAPAAEGEFRTLSGTGGDEGEPRRGLRLSAPLERMPVALNVAIPVRDFRVRNLLALKAGELIESQWVNGEDLPLSAGAVQLAWSEFEVVDTRLAVRVTRLA